jgi:hypothetical protein
MVTSPIRICFMALPFLGAIVGEAA